MTRRNLDLLYLVRGQLLKPPCGQFPTTYPPGRRLRLPSCNPFLQDPLTILRMILSPKWRWVGLSRERGDWRSGQGFDQSRLWTHVGEAREGGVIGPVRQIMHFQFRLDNHKAFVWSLVSESAFAYNEDSCARYKGGTALDAVVISPRGPAFLRRWSISRGTSMPCITNPTPATHDCRQPLS